MQGLDHGWAEPKIKVLAFRLLQGQAEVQGAPWWRCLFLKMMVLKRGDWRPDVPVMRTSTVDIIFHTVLCILIVQLYTVLSWYMHSPLSVSWLSAQPRDVPLTLIRDEHLHKHVTQLKMHDTWWFWSSIGALSLVVFISRSRQGFNFVDLFDVLWQLAYQFNSSPQRTCKLRSMHKHSIIYYKSYSVRLLYLVHSSVRIADFLCLSACSVKWPPSSMRQNQQMATRHSKDSKIIMLALLFQPNLILKSHTM